MKITEIVKSMCLSGDGIDVLLVIKHHVAWGASCRRDVYRLETLKGGHWEFVSTHDTLADATRAFNDKMLDNVSQIG